MKILINGYSVDFALSGEKDLKEVCQSILEWSKKRDLIFTDCYVNGDLYSFDDIPLMSLEDVRDINCLVQSKADLIISTLNEAVTYCDKILRHIAEYESKGKADLSQKDALVKGIAWMLDAEKVIFTILALDDTEIKYLDKTVEWYFEVLADSKKALDNKIKAEEFKHILIENKHLFETIKAVFKMLFLSDNLKKIILKSLESPNQLIDGLKAVKNDIADQVVKLEHAAVAFQSGRDAEGAEIIQSFIDFIYKYIRICHQISPVFGIDPAEVHEGDDSLEGVNARIYSYLEDILNVMENNDIISLSDILEYQMKPEIEKCIPLVDLVLEKIS